MQVISLNPNVTAFYFGGDCEPQDASPSTGQNPDWVFGCCGSLGLAVHAVHQDGEAVVYDTMCTLEQGQAIRAYLERDLATRKITVATSHWHIGHIGGNAVFQDCNIVSSRRTRAELLARQKEIESGGFWGEPRIKPLRLPDIVFENRLSIYVGGLEVQLLNFNIHSEDSVCLYIPAHKMLLPGDMLEDTIPFIADPAAIPAHLENYAKLRELDIEKISPCHGRSAILRRGGYSREFIDAVSHYLARLHEQFRRAPDSEAPDLRALMDGYLSEGVIGYWRPYEQVHQDNIAKLRAFFRANPAACAPAG